MFQTHKENALLKLYLEGYKYESTREVGVRFSQAMLNYKEESLLEQKKYRGEDIGTVYRVATSTASAAEQPFRADAVAVKAVFEQIQKISNDPGLSPVLFAQINSHCAEVYNKFSRTGLVSEREFEYLQWIVSEASGMTKG